MGTSEIAVEGFSARATYTRVVKEAIKRPTELCELKLEIKVSSWLPKGSGGSAAPLRATEVGACRLAGNFPDFESRATVRQAGQRRPGSLAAVGHRS
ncbi:hypothetical protein OS122_00045 [Mycolicibacterium mucogenicum]|uniref:hypothetical protein n=1 Tax=Mycolicibacterium mucogenicum TaxID=56689 RepID=UPI00226AB838|nr:hypothetical protein [Mycolicibacterium mucogenicum]MCX8559287.1 hypothetical protein [Mycolicibacterium mucogenicum]